MKRLEHLIDQSRRATDNTDFTDTTGIPTEEFIQYINDAQTRIQTLIVQTNPDVFQSQTEIDAVARQEAYDLPSDTFIGQRIDLVEYSHSGQAQDYNQLKQGRLSERVSGLFATPAFYIRRSGTILLQPAPESSGKIRVTYTKQLPRLDNRQGVVGSVTLDGSTRTITSLILDTTQTINDVELSSENYISVIDKYGTIKMKNIPISAVSAGSGVVSVDAGFVYSAGESISAGDYVVRGHNSTDHSELDDICERYLLEYCNLRILGRDSSDDVATTSPLLQGIEEDIVSMYREPDNDVDYVTMLDTQYLEPGDESDV